MRFKTSSLIATALLLGFSSAALASDKVQEADAYDEIEVTARYSNMSLSKIKRELNRSAEDFYDTFNDLNDIDDFHVRCKTERPTGSRIRNHVCKAKFIAKAETKHAERNWDNRLAMSNKDVNTGIMERTAEFEQHMSDLVASSPELQQKLAHYNTMISIVAQRLDIERQ